MYSAISANKRNTIFIMLAFIAIIGAVGWVLSYVLAGNASFAPWVIGVAAIYTLIQYFAASKMAVSMTGAVEIQKSDNPRLWRIVENLAITNGMPMPKVHIMNDPAPNAFATGRDPKHAIVAATTGIMDVMSDRELEAVMAHEMGHVKNYDIRVSMIAFGLVSAIGVMVDFVMNTFLFGGGNRDNNVNPVMMVIGVVVILLAPVMAGLIQMAVSRQREYLADATGVMTTRDSEGLASALEKLQQYGQPMQRQSQATAHLFFSNPLKAGGIAKLFSTHPPLEDRIARLRSNAEKF